MPKITRITTQKNNKNRYNIFLNDGSSEKYGFSVSEDILVEYYLRKGLELDYSTIDMLQTQDSVHKAYSMALTYLGYQMRSKQEVANHLEKKEVDEEQIPEIVNRLVREGLLDDRAFAEALVRTRMLTTSKGPILIKKELQDKGVSLTIAQEALVHYPYEAQIAKANKWVEKKLNSSNRKSFNQQIQIIQQTLMQKGFPQEVIKGALVDIKEAEDKDAEWNAVVFQGEKLQRKYEKKFEGFELKQKIKQGLYRKGFKFDYIDRFLEEFENENA
ncbi:recombination regulator RecX [Aquibacillus rhizosphaerae]|uniref:Regulatory protein RecX n=1 Tax=Aquibacillus rhizosphaerae TaxID=3051431 RepID=A0ABT7L9J6_9BACI|nr:recombination regulator RecX [Aquibacillus sp. LR5S19]MDL4841865.1 recombination regulator RecX [Aquibacillus sp. LR5S19]